MLLIGIYGRLKVGLIPLLIAAFGTVQCTKTEDYSDLPEKIDFNYHIRPILSQNCFVCHGPDVSTREANLRLDNFDHAILERENGGAAIVPRKAHKSLLLDRISSTDTKFRMPPPEAKKTLSGREIALLERWIDQGAEYKPHWAFITPELPKLPDSLTAGSPTAIIDHLVGKELVSKGLEPSPRASRSSLVRRVSYLLTGLPPSPEDVQNFVSDSSPDAYEKMIDRSLESPHFGERWARHWMDLVRYGEGLGHEYDFTIGGAWQYRDYLIRAFNQDVPYDLFVKEHLAGDMLAEPRSNPQEGYNESIFGTAHFFLGEGKHSPVDIKMEEADRIDNLIDVTSKTFQALTVSCARCHDHKFDPIPTTDYYSMYGMFESTRVVPHPAKVSPSFEGQVARLKQIKQEIREQVVGQLALAKTTQVSSESITRLANFVETLPGPKQQIQQPDHKIIGDFRQGTWKGWHSDGWAFGNGPMLGEPVLDVRSNNVVGLRSAVASSRVIGLGIPGALRSPNFLIENDSLAIRAAGLNGTIRIIVDNFQIIRSPLYGNLEIHINDPRFNTYVFDMDLVKGHKAYIEFMPGSYGGQSAFRGAFVFRSSPDDYIEIEYIVAFDKEIPNMNKSQYDDVNNSNDTVKDAMLAWANNKASAKEVAIINDWLEQEPGNYSSSAIKDLVKTYDSILAQLETPTYFIGVIEGDAVFSPVFIRGSPSKLSEERVPRHFLSATEAGPKDFPQGGSGRMAWAESVIDPNNPLTARVMVNRIWHHIFGRGIVESVDNFGVQGQLPSHPELLDYLALRFVEDNWSIKKMIRLIILSDSFRRSTEALDRNRTNDPNNIYLHHFPVRRLEAEAIRDELLAVSGRLDRTMYGEPVPVHLTEFMTGRGIPPASGPLDGDGRRSIYISIRRNFLSPMMLAFDMPIPFSTFGKRNTTNVPAQSLALLNDPFVHQQARNLAENILKDEDIQTVTDRVSEIYLRALSRKIRPEELLAAKTFLEMQAQDYGFKLEELENNADLWTDYCHSVVNLKEFIHLL